MTTKRKTVESPPSEARQYLAKADQFVEEARSAIENRRFDAAMLTAIHAAISAADAVTSALAGRRSVDPDHARAQDLLQEVVGADVEGRKQSRRLGDLISRKNVAAYESRRAQPQEATRTVEAATRFVGWARRVVQPGP